ncbi:MAG: IclR family transcriptional regulator [Cryobacterium sp.]|nr:IclR family transcriptional regulator [Cryobacterium sp.]
MSNTEVYRRPAYAITSVDHALRLIQILRDTGSLRVSDAAVDLGIAPSTAHRLLAMLVYRGFAIQDDSRSYFPGPALGAAPSNIPWTRTLNNLCHPHLELLSARLGETVNLVFRVGGNVRFLSTVESSNLVRVGDRTGSVLPARRASGGKALLAELDRAALDRLYRSKSAELSGDLLGEADYAALLRELERVRAHGFAWNSGETESGICAIGMCLRDGAGRALAAFSVSVPSSRADRISDGIGVPLMIEARKDMEADLAANGRELADFHG